MKEEMMQVHIPGIGTFPAGLQTFMLVRDGSGGGIVRRIPTRSDCQKKGSDSMADEKLMEYKRYHVNQENVACFGHGPDAYAVENGTVSLPAGEAWVAAMVTTGIIEAIPVTLVDKRLVSKLRLAKNTLQTLQKNDLMYVSEIENATDAELLALPGVGVVMVRKIRAAIEAV